MFASKTIGEHLVRGALGIGAVWVLLEVPASEPEWLDALGRIVLGLFAIVLLRGCPMCWLQGLVETIVARVRGRQARASCTDGSCSR